MKPKRVLIADDDASLCRILEVRFRHLGVHVTVAHDTMQALVAVHKDPPDLIVLDIHMPAGSGLAACEMLSEDRRLHGVPVVILSGRGDAETRERVARLGAQFVPKSGDLWRELRPLVCELLGLTPSLEALTAD